MYITSYIYTSITNIAWCCIQKGICILSGWLSDGYIYIYTDFFSTMKKPGGKFLWGFFDLRVQETEPFLFNQNNWSFSHLLNVQLPSPFLFQLAKCGMYHDLGILNRGYPKMDCFWFISPSKKNIPHIPLGNSPMFTCTFCQVIWRQPKISHAGPGSLGIRPNPNRQPWAGNLSPSCGSNIQVTINPSKTTQILGVWTGQSSMFPKGMEDHKKVWYTRSLSTKCWPYPSTSEPTKLVQEPRTGKIFGFWLLNRRHLGGSTTWKLFSKNTTQRKYCMIATIPN